MSSQQSPVRALPHFLAVIMAVTGVEFFETGMVTFSASHIMAALHLQPHQFALAYTLYGVTAIFMLYKHQWMVERLGYRDFIFASLGVFALGGVLCATAHGFAQFACGRALQGFAGATFFTAGRMLINQLPADKRFAGLLAFVTSLLGAAAIAPIAAAGLLSLGGWRSLFWVSLPLCGAVAWLAAGDLPRERSPAHQRSEEHWGWLVWLVLGVFGLQYAIQAIPAMIDGSLAQLLYIGSASIVVLSVFAWRQWHKDRPLINYRGLFQMRYLLGLCLYFCGYALIGAYGFMAPLLLQHGLGLSLGLSAAIMSLCFAGSVVAALIHALCAKRWPRLRLFMLFALLLYAAGCYWLSRALNSHSWHTLLIPLMMCSLSLPFFLGSVAFGTFTEVRAEVFSHAYQVKNIVRQLGLSSSISLSTTALQYFYAQPDSAGSQATAAQLESLIHATNTAQSLSAVSMASADVFLALACLSLPLALIVGLQRSMR